MKIKSVAAIPIDLKLKEPFSIANETVDIGENVFLKIETNEDIINAITFKKFLDDKNRIKFIMKEIKASLFVCRVMFAQMDVYNPFTMAKEIMIDAEEIMISQDFIPELIPAISQCYAEKHMSQLEDCFTLMNS